MRASFLECPVDILSMAETVDLARRAMRSRQRLQHVALNVAKLVNMRLDPVLAADVANSDVVSIDGMGIVWGARALGLPVKSRVAGVDLLAELLAVCASEGFKPYFLGATPPVLQRAVERVRGRHPSLVLAGYKDGYFGREDEAAVVSDIRASGADCLFIGMPTPRKERFLAAHRDVLGVPFIMGVGGSFDILAGEVRRAPARMQQLGLEWLYRVYQEPGRMWWRYARTNTLFAGILAQAVIRQILGAAPRANRVIPPGAGRVGG
ncbi:WecB/TagA/CpsF family glycosyltransferase [Bradyrhizobium sp. WD16]|uniref:WecB/TagA/CpsF family glycosyltransferase n=1 Tax=Bradyrhizobium sp. WD16 TaxID=1521768 RepID=UPI0022009A78|nr:WecB/TagA/CpsF family glycosyltransferase [Bradyrhizobium sp. WD16]UTD27955.1 glycosyltransferase [Bradyrhizobium sp. WD16]